MIPIYIYMVQVCRPHPTPPPVCCFRDAMYP